MRALLERSGLARAGVALLAIGAVLVLARAAEAGGDLGLRRDTFWPEPSAALGLVEPQAAEAPRRHRHARRIWAASRSRPLRITLARDGAHGWRHGRIAAGTHAHPGPSNLAHSARLARSARPTRSASARPAAEPPVVFPPMIVLPKPARPALVTIFQDRTLREGDAVMMADGIHVFHGRGEWPHRPRDFVRLTFAAALDWHLRRTLDTLDRNPPTRWSSTESAAG